jgi:polyphosphate kinase
MKPSQITIASAVGFLALIMIVMAGLGRVALSQSDPGTTQTADSSALIVGEQVVQAFELEGFHGVAIEGAWQVNLTRGDEWQVEVSHSEDLEDELNVHISGDQLVLDVTSSGGWRWWR